MKWVGGVVSDLAKWAVRTYSQALGVTKNEKCESV